MVALKSFLSDVPAMICPVCSSIKIRQLTPAYSCQAPNELFYSNYQLNSCEDCGIWFKDTVLSEEEINNYYKNLPTDQYAWEYTHRLPHELLIDDHLTQLPRGATVLDVGCWSGRLLAPYADRLKVYGIEPNQASAQIARERKIEILGDFVFNIKNISFDCVTLIDVYEHLPKPKQLIDQLLPLLNPKGRLIIVTGGTDNFAAKLASSTYWYFSLIPDHITFLNKKHIRFLQGQYPDFEIKYRSIRHSVFSFKRYFFELLWLVSWRFVNPNSPFRKVISYKLPFLSRLKNVKRIMLCLSFNDHYYIEFLKK